jgi:hypothetical protein
MSLKRWNHKEGEADCNKFLIDKKCHHCNEKKVILPESYQFLSGMEMNGPLMMMEVS